MPHVSRPFLQRNAMHKRGLCRRAVSFRLSVTFICLSVRLSRWCIQWLKYHWTQGNAVPVPPIIEIQRSHASSFIKTLVAPQLPVRGPKADVQFSHLRFFTLTTERILSKRTNT